MDWFNYYGLIFIVYIMIPNIIFAIVKKDSFINKYNNKWIEGLEIIGRYGSLGFMVFNIPGYCFGYWFYYGKMVYILLNTLLCSIYCILFVIYWNKEGVLRSLMLSILPSFLFILSGVMLFNKPLIITSILFAIGHIRVSYKNAVL